MIFILVFSAILLDVSRALPPGIQNPGSCQTIDDDCIEDYTSLLQESAHVYRSGKGGAGGVTVNGGDYDSDESTTSSFTPPLIVWSFVALAVLAFVVYWFLVRPNQRTSQFAPAGALVERRPSWMANLIVNEEGEEDVDVRKHDDLEEDTYSLAIALITRDLNFLASGKCKDKGLRYARISFAVGLVFLTVVLSVSILVCTKKYVTPQQVAAIRSAYDSYQTIMYNNHTYLNENGKNRGLPGYFNASAFAEVGDDQGDVCNIPLSELSFLGTVLLIWTITCTAQLKACAENFVALIFFAGTVDSMADAIVLKDDDDDDDANDDCNSDIQDGIPTSVIVGLTLPVKVFLILCVFIPDFGTTCYVLWLGSRWLVATNDFGNLISNAVALEFILMTKKLLFLALVTDRNRRDLKHTGLAPSWSHEPAGYMVYFSTIVWAFLAALWVYYYVYIGQAVLPDYKWDVQGVCRAWFQAQLDPDA
jgi:hypothetical protein